MSRTYLEGQVPQNSIASIFKDASMSTNKKQLERHLERSKPPLNQLVSMLLEFANTVPLSIKKNGMEQFQKSGYQYLAPFEGKQTTNILTL